MGPAPEAVLACQPEANPVPEAVLACQPEACPAPEAVLACPCMRHSACPMAGVRGLRLPVR